MTFKYEIRLSVNLFLQAKNPNKEEHEPFIRAVFELCKYKDMWIHPRIKILKMDVPNAVAYGWGFFGQCSIGVTPKILEILDYNELKAVLAHELAHIRSKDVGLSTVISILTGGLEKARAGVPKQGIFGWAFSALLWFVSKILFGFLRSAISQERELAADALGASYIGSPDDLISAFRKFEVWHKQEQEKKGEKVKTGSILSDLLISHPGMEERIAALESLKINHAN